MPFSFVGRMIMEAALTISQILEIAGIIVAIWGGYKAITEIIARINDKHDQIQKWDEYDKQIKAIKEEQCLLTFGMLATLDGLKQLNCNGKVTEARDKIDRHLNKTAHGVVE